MQYKRVLIIETALILVILSACGQEKNQAYNMAPSEETDSISEGSLEAQDTAIYLGTDAAASKVSLKSTDSGMEYELVYDDLTAFSDRYGQIYVLEQYVPGEIVNVTLSVHSRKLLSMCVDGDSFERSGIDNFDLNMNRGVFSADDVKYRLTEKTAVIKDGRQASVDDINAGDILTIRGVDKDLYSIEIMSGAGHVRISGTGYFTGGWLQIGRSIIKPITDEMLLDVPEGDYDMTVIYHGHGGTKHITVRRGEETQVDVSDLKGELIKSGRITFTVTPPDAVPEVRINGEKIDYLQPVELEYGIYSLEVLAPGYQTVSEKINVGQEMANIEIELQEADSTSSDSASSSSSSRSSSSSSYTAPSLSSSSSSGSAGSYYANESASDDTVSTGTNRLYIDAPEGAEVYYDGSYKGVVPCSFKKSSGTHVISLREDGYETRTYTITLDDSTDNETYSFSELTESSE